MDWDPKLQREFQGGEAPLRHCTFNKGIALPDGSRILHYEVLDNVVRGVRLLWDGKTCRFSTTLGNWEKLTKA